MMHASVEASSMCAIPSARAAHARFPFALAVLVAIATAAPAGAYVEPQAIALGRLRALSQTPVDARFAGGFPRSLRLDVAAPAGATPTARARAFLTQWQDVFSQNHADLALHPVTTESAEQEVVAFYQTFRGIPVFGAQLAVGMQQSAVAPPRITFTTGWLLPAFPNIEDVEIQPCITPQMAEDAARLALGRLDAPVVGETILMLFSRAALDASNPPIPILVYRVTLGGGDATQFLVDADTQAIAYQHALVFDGPGLDDYDADFEDANGGTLPSTDCFTSDDASNVDIGSEGGLDDAYESDPEAVALWWHTRDTYLAFHDQLGRHSWDDDDGEIPVYLHIGLSSAGNPNANYSPSCDAMQFHDIYVGLDVVGHEFTHGVISHSISNLKYQGQSGALNEAFADGMAALVVDPADWLLAEGLLNGGGPIRSLSDPQNDICESAGGGETGTCNQPDRWSLYVDTTSDSGGVHTNSGIQNKATFLMTEGGFHNGRNVTAMGRTRTSRLLYFLTRYLQPTTATFSDARDFAVATAQTFVNLGFYGFSAANICTVRNAYAAVEIGQGDVDCDGLTDAGDDSDADGVYDDEDDCPLASNPSQTDFDDDGFGDACDSDGDNDGIPNGSDLCELLANSNWYLNGDPDGDGFGRACDPDDDNDGVPDNGGFEPCQSGQTDDCDDNCVEDANPTQFDGNDNGEGDACDPDQDGDGLYVEEDNCTFVANADQANADGDAYGDACDDCPDADDHVNAYTPGIPELGLDPQPYQPDSDGDGIPDPCDDYGFGEVGVLVDGAFSSIGVSPKPDGRRRAIEIVGSPGGAGRIPIDICDPGGDPDGYASGEYVELGFEGLLPAVQASIVDDEGNRYGLSTRPRVVTGGPDRGFRWKPRCDRDWFLVLELGPDFPGADTFTLVPRVVPGGGGTDNPWTSIAETIALPPPDPPADDDDDGAADVTDNCPLRANPEQYDADGDDVGDVCDNCSRRANANQLNTNRDPYGNACDPDYDNDERVGISDFNVLRTQFGNRSGVNPAFNPDVDNNGDGVIGLPDFNVLRSFFGGAPGPAGALR
jgi:Zn-dependent metalloprotease